MTKHAQLCGFNKAGGETPLREGIDLGYRLEGDGDRVFLSVCKPQLKGIRGFIDRFYGLEWISVLEAEFAAGTKVPKIVKNETSMELDTLLALIRAERIVPISRERDAEEIHKVFPEVIDVYSLQMFAHIYRNKGFGTDRVLPRETEKKLLKKLPDESTWDGLADGQEKIPMLGSVYRYRGEHYILQLVLDDGGEKTVFLFSRGYCACSRQVSLYEILEKEYFLAGKTRAAVRIFDKVYPEYHLEQYAGMSENILFPLLAADYHTGIELAAKSGVPAIAENYDQLSDMDKDPALYRNLKKMFGLPITVLRALTRDQACDAVLERMKQINAYNPVFLQFEAYTASMIEFYMRADIDRRHMRNGIDGIDDLTDRQILQILRYLEKHPRNGHYYCDYLNACARLGEYPYGLTPDIPIREAHDRTVARVRNNHDRNIQEAFARAVSAESYRSLATCFTEEDKKKFKDDAFIVTVPEQSDDLFVESENMHNCVRLYVNRVAYGEVRIYFLRQKSEPDKSYGTLEITGDGFRLHQAKAFANERLRLSAQKFVVKWCRVKGIKIDTWDIDRQARAR